MVLKKYNGIYNHSLIDSSAFETDCYVGPFATIGGGKDWQYVKIHDHVVIESDVVIGDHTTIFSGAKILSKSQIGKLYSAQQRCYWFRWFWV